MKKIAAYPLLARQSSKSAVHQKIQQCAFQPSLPLTAVTSPLREIPGHKTLENLPVSGSFANAKPYSDVPKPQGLPFVGTVLHYIFNGGGKYLHEYIKRRHRQLGPIFREKYSTEPFEVLFIGDVEGTRDVYKNEGKTPLSFVIGGEQLYMKLRGVERGLLFNQGEEWLKLRRPMNNFLLKRTDYYDHFDLTSKIISEHLNRWDDGIQEGGHVNNIVEKVNELGINSFGAFAFGEMFDAYREEIQKDAEEFYPLIRNYWNANMKMQIIPPHIAHKLRLPVWSRFETAVSSLLDIGRKWTDWAKCDLKDENFGNRGGFLHTMLRDYDAPGEETVRRIFSDLIPALESETTMIQWIIYTMGQNKEAQEKLYAEIAARGDVGTLTWRQVDEMPYLTACIKECLRMYPSNCFTVRILPEEAVIKGYRVPAGTIAAIALMSSQRQPSIFPSPDKFWPERWFRASEEDLDVMSASEDNTGGGGVRKPIGVHGCQPYVPFAWGSARGCIFRKISTKRMSLFLANLVKIYSFETSEVKPIMRSLMIPDRDMKLKVFKRNLYCG